MAAVDCELGPGPAGADAASDSWHGAQSEKRSVIYRPSQIGTFEFAVLAARRAEQLRRGCVPRVEGGHKFTVTAQLEVIAGKVVRSVEGTVQDLPDTVGPTQAPAVLCEEKEHRGPDVANTSALASVGLHTGARAMDDPNRNRTTGTQCWTLHKDGRQTSWLVTDLERGGFELKLTRSDAATRSVQLFRVREDAIVEVERQLRNHIAHGWAIHGDRR